MPLLRDLVTVNQAGMLHSSINFGLMDDPDTNLELCKSYVFNYDRPNPTASTLGVLDRVRNSFHSPNNANVHCMVMEYGKGKSHLGLVLANFFSKAYDSPEVRGILHQITQATVAHPAIGQSIDSFKKNQSKPHLVLCLSGDWGGSDLRQHIFNCLLKTLHQAGLDPAPLNLCAEPLRYLAKVQASPAKEDKANAFLHQKAETGETEYDIQSLVSLLRQNTTEVIPLVKEICRHLEGFAPDFNPDINVTELLTAVLETYCKGNEAPFKGMLIIFDEMNYYLNFWKSNEIAAGGTALQNITNLCENYKGILALLSFTQIRFRTEVGSNVNSRDSYLRISTRIAPKDATYEPRSSLELVLDNLLVQQEHTEAWKEFEQKWRETFTAEARYLYEGSGKNYLTQGWTEQQVRQTLSAGCFPLHPYTTYLLANLSFTQDRTAIQFLRSTVTDFINSEPAETPGGLRPNYLYATTLVDSFLENYNSTLQEQYKTALQLLSGSDNEAEYQVVRALFLYGASEGKLTKTHDQEDHKVILGHLTGLGPLQLNAALDRLTNHYRALYHNPASKLYSFYQGANPTMLEDEIDRRIANLTSSIEEVVSHAQSKLSTYLSTNTLPGIAFVETKRLVEKDWEFEQRFVSPDSLTRLLTNAHSLQNVTQRGLVVYVLAETQEELQSLNRTLDTRLSQSPVGDRIVVAIPSMATDDLDLLLLKRQTLSKMDFEERRNYGEAYSQLLSQWDRDIQTSLQQILKNCTYHCRDMASLTSQERQQAHALVSHLLTQRYPFVPTVQSVDKLRSKHTTGQSIVRFVSQRLFCNDLTDQTLNGIPNKSAFDSVITGVYCQAWGLLNHTGRKYKVQIPQNAVIRQAWDYITTQAKEAKATDQPLVLANLWTTLSQAPYGYSEYNFVILLAGWLCYHRKQVLINGRKQLNGSRHIPVETQKLGDWSETDIFTNPKTFVDEWIVTHRAKIIFRNGPVIPEPLKFPVSWENAHKYLEAVEKCLGSDDIEANEKLDLMQQGDQVATALKAVTTWLEPVLNAERLFASNDIYALIQTYPKLWENPPTPDISGKPFVTLSQEQRNRQTTARDRLEQLLIQDITTLPTPEACNLRQQQIQKVQEITAALPEPFTAFLQKSQEAIEKRRKDLPDPIIGPIIDLEIEIKTVLQRFPAPEQTPLITLEQARQTLAQLQTRLQDQTPPLPNTADLSQAITDRDRQIQEQITGHQTQLKTLEAGLASVVDRTSFDRCRQTYAKLALIFQGSSQENNLKNLNLTFSHLEEDLKHLDKLQSQLDTSQSLADCDRLSDQMAQTATQLHRPDQFQAAFSKIQTSSQKKAKTWIENLDQQSQRLQQLTSLTEARTYQTQLLSTNQIYAGSATEATFTALAEQLHQWLDFFQRVETTPSNTLEQCQTKLRELDSWHQQQTSLSPALQEQFNDHRTDLNHNLQILAQTHQDQAQQWWQTLNQEAMQIHTLEDKERFKMILEVQKALKEGWPKHGRFIPDRKQAADDLQRQCIRALDEHKADRIKQQFRELPRSQRQTLLKELYAILKAETEVF